MEGRHPEGEFSPEEERLVPEGEPGPRAASPRRADSHPREGKRFGRRFLGFCRRHAFKPRSVLTVLICAIIGVVALGFLAFQRTGSITKTTALGLRNIGELATQAGYFTTVQTISKSRNVLGITVPGTQSNYIYSYDGTIKAGIDFGEIETTVDELRREIRVRFPEFRILSTEIDDDSFILYNDGANLFTSLKLEDVDRGNAELKQNARETAIKNGILENARANAEVLIRGYLAGIYDLESYTLIFEPETSAGADETPSGGKSDP